MSPSNQLLHFLHVTLQLVSIALSCSCIEKHPVQELCQLLPPNVLNPCTMEPPAEVCFCVAYLAFEIAEQASPLFGSFQWWMNRFLLQVRTVPEEEEVEYCLGEEIAL
jgi:hypothetical protein